MPLDHLISPRTRYADLGPLALECGATLAETRIAYQTWGEPRSEAVLICHALTGSADAADWWPGLIGPGCALDPERDFILCCNVLGGCYGTTGPTSQRAGADTAWQVDFPPVTIRDMVHLQARLLDHLGIERLELVTGGSMGGMQALEWPLLYPDRVRAIAPIAVSARHSSWCIGLSEAQRRAITNDPRFRGGHYPDDDPPLEGLALARMIAICTYRSWPSFQLRFGRERRDSETFQVESYLHYQGEKLIERFDANTYLTLTRAMDSHDVGRGRDDDSRVLGSVTQPALVVSVSSDVLYPPEEQRELSALLGNARLATIESPHGHDAFLIEIDQLARHLAEFLSEVRATRTTAR